ncbi:outer membrane beta-barrel protein [Hymenobacter sediminicola]|uniref:Outer membrane beta-barrel protein n=1 Tax=Hymenobacter sediminicola TaxID=2761579 RepID=A0A7G7WA08_9BACT|nr:outer membrane beta-barrel protein [Hymenobacter sediminicola]QNH63201.1 outer membrane beta-barrel protein [Hymenobacter sediminicola]
MRTFLRLLPALCLVAPAALAQSNFKPGYILQPSGDTLRGEVDYRSEQRNRKLCRFRPASTTTVTEYQPEQLQGYGFSGGRNYQSRQLPGATAEKAFLQVLALGNASLYLTVQADDREAYYAGRQNTGPLQLLVQRDTTIMAYNQSVGRETKTMQRLYPFRSKLAALMSDCPKVQASIVNMELREQKLLQLFSDYNTCAGGSVQYSVPETRTKVGVSVLGGSYQSTLTQRYDETETELKAARSSIFGVGLVVQPGFFHHKLSAVVQALYVKQEYEKTYQGLVSGGLLGGQMAQRHTVVNITSIRLPLLVRYTFLQGGVRPYLQAGLVGTLQTQTDARVETEVPRFGTDTREIEMRTTGFGGLLGAGISIPTGNVGSLQLEARAEWFDGSSQATKILSGARGLGLLAGYTFGK